MGQIKNRYRFVSRGQLMLSCDLPLNSSKYHHLSDRMVGGNAPLNTTAQSVLNTKQDGIKWMHSGFYEGHCNIFLYYSLGLRDAYPTTKESQGLKITVLHYHQSTKKKLYINQLNWYVSKRATCKK